MYVKTPGRYYSSIIETFPKTDKGQYFDKVSGKFMPLQNDDLEDSYYYKDDSDIIPEDPHYNPKYNDSDEDSSLEDSVFPRNPNEANSNVEEEHQRMLDNILNDTAVSSSHSYSNTNDTNTNHDSDKENEEYIVS